MDYIKEEIERIERVASSAPADALVALLSACVGSEGAEPLGHLVLYTSFGVVRGRTGLNFSRELSEGAPQIIEISDVTVEHYSNHLPTGNFDRLYLRPEDVRGFAVLKPED